MDVMPDQIIIISTSETNNGLEVEMYVVMPSGGGTLPADVLTEIIDVSLSYCQ